MQGPQPSCREASSSGALSGAIQSRCGAHGRASFRCHGRYDRGLLSRPAVAGRRFRATEQSQVALQHSQLSDRFQMTIAAGFTLDNAASRRQTGETDRACRSLPESPCRWRRRAAKHAPEHHEVLLPEGADSRFADSAVLWNAAEAAERRRDAQVAPEIVLALPANAELTDEDRIGLARSFAQQHFVTKGPAVQLDVHRPHEGEGESERANWHAHLLITTRRLEGEGPKSVHATTSRR
jgi:hypothetical protein